MSCKFILIIIDLPHLWAEIVLTWAWQWQLLKHWQQASLTYYNLIIGHHTTVWRQDFLHQQQVDKDQKNTIKSSYKSKAHFWYKICKPSWISFYNFCLSLHCNSCCNFLFFHYRPKYPLMVDDGDGNRWAIFVWMGCSKMRSSFLMVRFLWIL